jgi:hypothetical protein
VFRVITLCSVLLSFRPPLRSGISDRENGKDSKDTIRSSSGYVSIVIFDEGEKDPNADALQFNRKRKERKRSAQEFVREI